MHVSAGDKGAPNPNLGYRTVDIEKLSGLPYSLCIVLVNSLKQYITS